MQDFLIQEPPSPLSGCYLKRAPLSYKNSVFHFQPPSYWLKDAHGLIFPVTSSASTRVPGGVCPEPPAAPHRENSACSAGSSYSEALARAQEPGPEPGEGHGVGASGGEKSLVPISGPRPPLLLARDHPSA